MQHFAWKPRDLILFSNWFLQVVALKRHFRAHKIPFCCTMCGLLLMQHFAWKPQDLILFSNWFLQVVALKRHFKAQLLIFLLLWSKLILRIVSTWYCSCDWTVNSAATTIEIEVAYSSHSYWYCNCDCIVNTAAMLPKLKLYIACTATDTVTVIEL